MRIPTGIITRQTADMLNDFIERTEQFLQLSVTGPLSLSTAGMRPVINAPDAGILIEITGREYKGNDSISDGLVTEGDTVGLDSGSTSVPLCCYSWKQVRSNALDCEPTDIHVRQGWANKFPAKPTDQSESIATGTRGLAFEAETGDHYVFVSGGGGCSNDDGNIGCIQIVTDVTCDLDIGYRVEKANFWFPKCLGIKVWDFGNDDPCICCAEEDGISQLDERDGVHRVFGAIFSADSIPFFPPTPPDCDGCM